MSKHRQRARRQARTHRSQRPRPQAPTPDAALCGWTREMIYAGGTALAQDLSAAALKAQALARGGAPLQGVMGHFLAPLKFVYQTMDALSTTVRTRMAQDALAPACAPGCCACCRLYVEVGPWEAFGIADYVTQACEQGLVSRGAVLTLLQEEVTRYVQSGGDTTALRLCAFVTQEGTCGIYPARPSACRTYYSRSRAACERYFAQPVLHDTCDGRQVRMSDHGLAMTLTLAESQVAAQPPLPLGESTPFYEMQSMVLRILETPGALVRYLHGENIFDGCARFSPEADLREAHHSLVQLQVPKPEHTGAVTANNCTGYLHKETVL